MGVIERMSTLSIPFSDKYFKRFKSITGGLSSGGVEKSAKDRAVAELRLRALEHVRAWESIGSPLPGGLDVDAQYEERAQRRIHFDYAQSLYKVSFKHARSFMTREATMAAEALASNIEVSLATNDFGDECRKRIQQQFDMLCELLS